MNTKFENPSCETCQSRIKSVFCGLKNEELTELSLDKNCTFYKKGQIIFFEGNRPSGLYCVSKGQIKTYKTGNEGKEQIVRLVKGGDILGYRALIGGEVYSASATALEDSTVCFIPTKLFFELLQKNSDLSSRIMKLLSKDLKSAENTIASLAQKPVRERLAETILMLKEFYGMEEDGKTLKVHLSREDIANITGTATETAIRLLSEFKQEGIIELQGKKIKIIKPETLLKTANLID